MIVRTLSAAVLLAALAFPAAAAEGGEISGVEPVSGQPVAVAADGPLTHLVFLAAWCPPCLAELPALRDLEERWAPDGYRLVLVAIRRRESMERVSRFVNDRQPPGTVLYDQSGSLESRFALEAVPLHVLLDRTGSVLLRASSLRDGVAEVVEHTLVTR